ALNTPVSHTTDPHWANVVSLLHFDGSNSSTTITDETGTSWTAYDGAAISTAQSVFGGASAFLDGGSDTIRHTSDQPDFDFGSGDFTIECRIRPSSLPALVGQYRFIISKDNTSSTRG